MTLLNSEQTEPTYWLTPVADASGKTASQVIQNLVVEEQMYAFHERLPASKRLKPGDWICFYAKRKGIVAHARVVTKPERQVHTKLQRIGNYPWVFKLEGPRIYDASPVVLDGNLRSELDAFKGHDLDQQWSWFVQSTRKISRHDFEALIRQ